MRRLAMASAALAMLAGASSAEAHTRSVSYSTWSVHGDEATVQVRVSRLDHEALLVAAAGDDLGPRLQQAVVLRAGTQRCAPVRASFEELRADPQWRRYEWRVRCPTAGALAVRSDLLFDLVPAHVHFARVGDVELTLGEDAREAAVPAPCGAIASAGRFVGLGITHIFGGLDHLVFLITLILVAGTLRDVGFAVTGFTLGHSVTLALTTLGIASPHVASVEALIGLSIALVAVENVWMLRQRRGAALPATAVIAVAAAAGVASFTGAVSALAVAGAGLFAACYLGLLGRSRRPARLRAGVAGLFGLVHGFGFAGVLQQMDLGADRIVGPLLGFNLGVEIGQLLLVAALWPVLVGLRRLGPISAFGTAAVGSAVAVALGVFWFVSRAYG